ncbi:MAG: transporter substrate-binding domain-containing protein [Deltaproteobacteria bacterium]|nr:transporter substrate-binding domain-containing protein [Deltaproteobacteria bacterium]
MATACSIKGITRGLCRVSFVTALACLVWLPPTGLADNQGSSVTLEKHTGDLPEIRDRKLLRVLVTHSRTDFFLLNRRPRGLMYELMREYEKFLNRGISNRSHQIRITFVPVSFDRLIPALREGRGDIAASLLTLTPEREQRVAFATKPDLTVSELVVSHKNVRGLKNLNNLSARWMYVLRGSSYAEHLRDLNTQFKNRGIKPVNVEEADSYLLAEDILELMNAGVVELTVIDDFRARLWAQVFPNIVVHEHLRVDEGNQVGLAVRKDNPLLQKHLTDFLKKTDKSSILGSVLFRRYYENARWIKNPTSRIEVERLNQYIDLIKKYCRQHGFDYLAVAAQAYFGSNLDPSKTGAGGAVGLMQILPSTAADPNVNIPDIEQVENNIHAGVKYLAFLRNRFFSDPNLTEGNRLAFTLAAYNAGPGEVQKMRILAGEMGLDPNEWFNHVELAAGQISGGRIVKYVSDVYKYYLAFSLAEKQARLQPTGN